MAENWSAPVAFRDESPADDQAPTWGDYAKAVGASGYDLGAYASAAGRYIATGLGDPEGYGKLFGSFEGDAAAAGEDVRSGMSSAAKSRLQAAITDGKFWEHPFSEAALKLSNSSASFAAGIIPAVVASGPLAATAAVAAAGGAINASQVMHEIFDAVDKADDKDLRSSAYYNGLRALGVSEDDAKAQLGQQLQGFRPGVAFLIGAVTNAFGPTAQIARGLKGGAAGLTAALEKGSSLGRIGSAGAGALEGGVSGAIQGGSSNIMVQGAEHEAGTRKEFDTQALVNAVLEPAGLGVAVGVATGAAFPGNRGKAKPKDTEIPPPEVTPEVTAPKTPSMDARAELIARQNEQQGLAARMDDQQGLDARPELLARQAEQQALAATQPVTGRTGNASKPIDAREKGKTEYPKEAEKAVATSKRRGKKGAPAEVKAEMVDGVAPDQAAALADANPTPTPEPAPEPPVAQAPREPTPRELALAAAQRVEQTGRTPAQEALAAAQRVPAPEPAARPAPETVPPVVQPAEPPKLTKPAKPPKVEQVLARTEENGRRVLGVAQTAAEKVRDVSLAKADEIKTQAAAKKAERAAAKLARAESGEKAPSKKGAAQDAKRAAADAVVKDVYEAHPPTADEANALSDKPEEYAPARKAVLARAKAMVADARSKGGRIFIKLEGENKKSPHQSVLSEARALAQLKSPKTEDYVRFVGREQLHRAGRSEEANADRAVEGDLKLKRSGGDSERSAGTVPEVIEGAPKEAEGVLVEAAEPVAKTSADKSADGGSSNEIETRTGPVASRKAAPRIDDGTETKEVAGLGNVAVARAASEVRKVDPGTVKAEPLTPEQLAAFKKRKAEKEAAKAAAKSESHSEHPAEDHEPAVSNPVEVARILQDLADGKIQQGEARARLNRYDVTEGQIRAALEQTPDAVLTRKKAGQSEPVRLLDRAERDEHAAAQTKYTTTGGALLDGLDFGHLRGLPAKLAPLVRSRLRTLIGDTPVHVVSKETMADLVGRSIERGDTAPDGMWRARDGAIYLNVDAMSDPVAAAHVALHEGLHAAISRVLDKNQIARTHIKAMMDEVAAHLANRLDVRGEWEHAKYALSNEHEFLSEAVANHEFQKILSRVPLSDGLARKLKLEGPGSLSMWSALVSKVRQWLGLPPGTHVALEGALRAADNLMHERAALGDAGHAGATHLLDVDKAREWAGTKGINWNSSRRQLQNHLSNFRWLVDRASKVVPGGEKLLRAVENLHREAASILRNEGGLPLIRDIAVFTRKSPAEFAKAARILLDASSSRVELGPNAKNEHLGKDKLEFAQSKARLPGLQKRFSELSPEAQALAVRTAKFFSDMHDKESLELIRNVLRVAGKDEPGLAERIHAVGLSDDEKALFETNSPVLAIDAAMNLKKLKGWYVPFRRFGEHLVAGEYDIATPSNATKIRDGVFQFLDPKFGDAAARRAANAFATASEFEHLGTKRVWVDKTDPTKIVDGSDANAVPAYRVTLQNKHMSAHPDEASARAHLEELSQDTDFKGRVEVKRNAIGQDSGGLIAGDLAAVRSSLEKQDRFKNMGPTERASLLQALGEATIRATGSTRLSSRLQRRKVSGMSEDLGRVVGQSAGDHAHALARLRAQPDIDAAWKAIEEHAKANQYDKNSVVRSEFINALESRLHERPERPSKISPAVTRLLQISRLDKLASPAFHIINAHQPWTTALPVIGGRHGIMQTARAMSEVYNLIGGRRGIMSGLRDTAKAWSSDFGFTDYVKQFQDAIQQSPAIGPDRKARMISTLQAISDRQLMSDEAIFEMAKHSNPSSNVVFRALDRADLIANQLGVALESINRAVTALTASELEFRRTKNHELANDYATRTVADSMYDYSSWNASPIFKGNLGRMALQFKKYGTSTWYLIGKSFRGMVHGDMESARQFGGLMITHAMMAGALGLPLEPFKVALMAAGWFGITNYNWEDVQNFVRMRTAEVLGKKGGEIVSHGLYRALGVEVSGRVGLDTLMTGFAPKGNAASDIKAYLWDTVAGAPASIVLDQIAAAKAMMAGDPVKAAELMIPIKAASDLIKAGRGFAGPTMSSSGREKLPALSVGQAAIQALGFQPAARAEASIHGVTVQRLNARQTQERQALEVKWHMATPNERAHMWGEIERWNHGRPTGARLTRAQLDSYSKSRNREILKTQSGVKVTKQNQDIVKNADVYVH